MTISEIKAFPDHGDAFISLLEKDKRVGVRKYAQRLRKIKRKEEFLYEKTLSKRKIENDLYQKGYENICGLDEVGRGPLAGPVLSGAVILPANSLIVGIDDSKKVSSSKREELAKQIKKQALSYSFGRVEPERIDEINIYNATKEAMLVSIDQLNIRPDILMIDSLNLQSGLKEISLTHGDNISYVIGAASIIAKVERDKIMKEYSKIFPEYGFERNKGYGTKEHIKAIKKYGLTPIHRRSFCKKWLTYVSNI